MNHSSLILKVLDCARAACGCRVPTPCRLREKACAKRSLDRPAYPQLRMGGNWVFGHLKNRPSSAVTTRESNQNHVCTPKSRRITRCECTHAQMPNKSVKVRCAAGFADKLMSMYKTVFLVKGIQRDQTGGRKNNEAHEEIDGFDASCSASARTGECVCVG